MQGVTFTPLRRIPTPGGDVRHGMKSTDPGYAGFGEAYFSTVEKSYVKGWKRHRRMTLNFVVPCGEIKIWVHNEEGRERATFLLGPGSETYGRLTISPGLWVAFGGVADGLNLLLNLASIPHDPQESDQRPLETFPWSWLD